MKYCVIKTYKHALVSNIVFFYIFKNRSISDSLVMADPTHFCSEAFLLTLNISRRVIDYSAKPGENVQLCMYSDLKVKQISYKIVTFTTLVT